MNNELALWYSLKDGGPVRPWGSGPTKGLDEPTLETVRNARCFGTMVDGQVTRVADFGCEFAACFIHSLMQFRGDDPTQAPVWRWDAKNRFTHGDDAP